jgi:hypothetical protein
MSRRLPLIMLGAAALLAVAASSAHAAGFPKLDGVRGDVKPSTAASAEHELPTVLVTGYQTSGRGD